MAHTFTVDVATPAEDIEVWDDYVGRGYALSRDEELRCIVDVARREGLVLDPVYTGKALYGLLSELRHGRTLREPIVFIHTGGIYGLLAKGDELLGLLDP